MVSLKIKSSLRYHNEFYGRRINSDNDVSFDIASSLLKVFQFLMDFGATDIQPNLLYMLTSEMKNGGFLKLKYSLAFFLKISPRH